MRFLFDTEALLLTSPPGGGVPRNFPLPSGLQINLQGDGLHIHDEYDLSSYQLDFILFYYRGIVDQIIKATGMENDNKVKTPVMMDKLRADICGSEWRNDDWSYTSVVGMLLHLAGNTQPDIDFAVHQAARFSHRPM